MQNRHHDAEPYYKGSIHTYLIISFNFIGLIDTILFLEKFYEEYIMSYETIIILI
jgi:hypothetical protein